MKSLYIIFVVFGASHLFADAMQGAKVYSIEKVPYMAQLNSQFKDGLNFCGATILSEYWLLSAAHCVRRDDKLLYRKMRLGTNKTLEEGDLYKISKIIVHKKYFTHTRWNGDLALIKLEQPITFDEKRQPISISKKTPKPGTTVDATGYGYDINGDPVGVLQFGRQNVMKQNDCIKAYSSTPLKNITIDNRVFCVESTVIDLCGGDSGSPGVVNGKIVGVAVEGCEAPLPNVYVNVAHYYDWIVRTTGLKFD